MGTNVNNIKTPFFIQHHPFKLQFIHHRQGFILPAWPNDENASFTVFPCQKDPTNCHHKDNRRCSDKQPLKRMKTNSDNSSFRIAIIPAQIGTVPYRQNRKNDYYDYTQRDKQPMKYFPPGRLPLGKLQVYNL